MVKSRIAELLDDTRAGKMSDDELQRAMQRYIVDVEDMANLYIIDEDEEREILARISSGDDGAKEELMDKHLSLVISIALDYLDDEHKYIELIDTGIKGLKTAVERYDTRVGYQFAVHAVWWIRQTIVRSINKQVI